MFPIGGVGGIVCLELTVEHLVELQELFHLVFSDIPVVYQLIVDGCQAVEECPYRHTVDNQMMERMEQIVEFSLPYAAETARQLTTKVEGHIDKVGQHLFYVFRIGVLINGEDLERQFKILLWHEIGIAVIDLDDGRKRRIFNHYLPVCLLQDRQRQIALDDEGMVRVVIFCGRRFQQIVHPEFFLNNIQSYPNSCHCVISLKDIRNLGKEVKLLLWYWQYETPALVIVFVQHVVEIYRCLNLRVLTVDARIDNHPSVDLIFRIHHIILSYEHCWQRDR